MIVSRDELYRLVWETPMVRLGQQIGISGNGLAKICRRLDVPYPPRGWWAKKGAGNRVLIAPLPEKRTPVPERVEITRTPAATNGLRQAIRDMQDRLPEIIVPERLNRPHPLIAGWLSNTRQLREEARRERNPLKRRT